MFRRTFRYHHHHQRISKVTESWTHSKGLPKNIFVLSSSSSSTTTKKVSSKKTIENEKCKTIVIVGAGVGGLAIASRLASSLLNPIQQQQQHGINTTTTIKLIVLEKNNEDWIGGRCGSFHIQLDGYGSFRHERGPSLLLLQDEYQSLFQDCTNHTKHALDYGLHIVPCIPAYQVVFEDGDVYHLGFPMNVSWNTSSTMDNHEISLLQERTERRMNDIEIQGLSKWKEYMQITDTYLNCGLPNFIEEQLDLSSFPAFLRESLRDGAKACVCVNIARKKVYYSVLMALTLILYFTLQKAWPLRPHSDVLDAIFTSTKMKAMASFQDFYVGLEPYRNMNQRLGGILSKTAPAVFGLLSALELHPTNRRAGGMFYYKMYHQYAILKKKYQQIMQSNHGLFSLCTNRRLSKCKPSIEKTCS